MCVLCPSCVSVVVCCPSYVRVVHCVDVLFCARVEFALCCVVLQCSALRRVRGVLCYVRVVLVLRGAVMRCLAL